MESPFDGGATAVGRLLGDHTITRSPTGDGAKRLSRRRSAERDGCLITGVHGWPSRAGAPRVSHEVMQELTTGRRPPVLTDDSAFVPGRARVAVGVGPLSRSAVVAVER